MSRCKACNNELHDVRSRAVEDEDNKVHIVEEDLCFKCLTIAIAAIHNADLDDDAIYDLQIKELYGTLSVPD